jgi:hypothetical protein
VTAVKTKHASQVRPLFLAACAGVLGLALLGVLLIANLGDSSNGLILGAGVLLAGAVGGMGLAVLLGAGRGPQFVAKSVAEPRTGGRRMTDALVFAFFGAAIGAAFSPAWVLPFLKKALPGAADNPLLWIASVAVGLTIGALVGVFTLMFRSWR